MNDKDLEIDRVRLDAERCISIFLEKLPDTECSKCPYKHLGVNCVLALIEAQNKVIYYLVNKIL